MKPFDLEKAKAGAPVITSDRWDLFEHLDTYHNPESAGI